ncbi:MAG: tetratricopeptide repeat protein [Anaerolineae bacterium]|jgi:tetratricopeptide (TPR) repeat protein|nr:tetratricopeptide repeat protein [Anaerolineae bacterium]MDH7472742.1 tetratricopeptide repeat protein [Anaerolineae bacterium]
MTLEWGRLRTSKLIGRRRECEMLRAAIEADGELRVVYVTAPAGVGKTRLLAEVPHLREQCPNAERTKILPLFDFYFTDVQSNSRLEERIISRLDRSCFSSYLEQREKFEKRRQDGWFESGIEDQRAQLAELFVQGFNDFTRNTRVILRFDTLELVQYEPDEVQSILGLAEQGIEVRSWLRTVLPKLRNTVVILAGREQEKPQVWAELQETFVPVLGEAKPLAEAAPDSPHVMIRLGNFSPDETADYFQDLAQVNPQIREARISRDDARAIHEKTGGDPLNNAFFSALIVKNARLPQDVLAVATQDIQQRLVEEMTRLQDGLDLIIPFMGWMRKGLNAELLHKILASRPEYPAWSQEECTHLLAIAQDLPFIKTREESDLLFLHDKMYDLVDQHILPGRSPVEKEAVCNVALEYHEKGSPEWLYYKLLLNPADGFHTYQELSDEAILSHEYGRAMRLRDEMLRFFGELLRGRSPEARRDWERRIARDAAIRWIRLYLAQGQFKKARELSDRIWEYTKPPFDRSPDDPLFTGALLLNRGEARGYLSEWDEGLDLLGQAIEILSPYEPDNPVDKKRRAWLLGIAHRDRGYIYRSLENYNSARDEYREAIRYQSELGDLNELASTERNLAFVFAQLGDFHRADEYITRSLDHFRETGSRWGTASSLNVFAAINADNDQPDRAEQPCRDALAMLSEIGDARTMGLTLITLVRTLRKQARRRHYRYSVERADAFLKEAEKRAQEALHIFQEVVPEIAMELTALEEQARLYRDWAVIYRRQDREQAEIEPYEKKAISLFETLIARLPPQKLRARLDVMEDLAHLHFERGELELAEQWVDQAWAAIDDRYRLQKDIGFVEIEKPAPVFWNVLGKLALRRGYIAHKRQQWAQAVRHWTQAFAYFDHFAPDAGAIGPTAGYIYRLLSGLPAETLVELEKVCGEEEAGYALGPTRMHHEIQHAIEDARG